ncbi:MAG TPA: DegT/DnrJ/EryC1/StrS family aminotransferase [Pirellulaceae bacterium]|nr:DegT/DnrJ/EryC1/StrS family aminotransferase [Pirellulaceae bacterium]HMO91550.1 DegT/DnrJ/EryC1/StrS family aminotransferase [Pirellulaceae bacterium]HMP68247.1 DegT/DnrJ/EryC1/StrS family aminotransferase [Pirellulaceae bacterium]
MNTHNSNGVTQVPLLDVNRSNAPILDEINDAIQSILVSGRFVGGPDIQKLEEAMAEVCCARFGIACASGSDALLLALMALGVKSGDEVIVPSFTFFASVSCITRLGARPVFVDIDPLTFNLDVNKINALITPQTRGIIPVHLFGRCADMTEINRIAQRHNLFVVEDVCQSIGATHAGQSAGSIGDVGCFSFYPTKNLGGFGDGGLITTNDEKLAASMRLYANHGMNPRYYHKVIGINSRLDTLQAAGLIVKLKYLHDWTVARRENSRRYRQLFVQHNLVGKFDLPADDSRGTHVWNQFTIRVRDLSRDEFRNELAKRKVGTEVYYPVPMHLQECFSYLGYKAGDLPETERAANQVISLPNFPGLTQKEQEYVVRCCAEICDSSAHPRRKAS